MLLKGEALDVWLELMPDKQKDFKVAKRKLQPGELFSKFVYDLKLLFEQTMPNTQETTCDQLLHR